MSPAKALRHVELLAREVSAIIDEDRELDGYGWVFDQDESNLLRDLRLALVQLDIARSEEAPSIYEASDR